MVTGLLRGRFVKAGLTVIGVLGVVIGFIVILSGVFFISPKVDVPTGALDQDLRLLEANLEAVSRSTLLAESAFDLGKTSTDLSRLIPETMVSLNGTLVQSAYALERMGSTLDALESGITGIVLPKTQIGRNVSSLQKVSGQLRLLAAMTQSMEPVLRRLSRESFRSSKGITQLQNDIPQLRAFVDGLRNQIQSVRKTIDPDLIKKVILAGCLFYGGIYFFLGFLFLALSMVYSEIEQMRRLVPFQESTMKDSERAA